MNSLAKYFLILLTPIKAMAASGGAVPAETVIYQIANLTLLVGFLYFSQRKNIAAAFAEKKQAYLDSVNAASNSKKEAEKTLAEVVKRVKDLSSTFAKQVEEAKVNAEELYRTQLADAKNEAVRIKSSAAANLEFETQKQIENLRVETFKKSADLAEEKLSSNLTPDQQKSWNNHFVKQQGVH